MYANTSATTKPIKNKYQYFAILMNRPKKSKDAVEVCPSNKPSIV
jgi:hypothetical protein